MCHDIIRRQYGLSFRYSLIRDLFIESYVEELLLLLVRIDGDNIIKNKIKQFYYELSIESIVNTELNKNAFSY